MSAPRRTTSKSELPHGCGRRSRSTSPRRSSIGDDTGSLPARVRSMLLTGRFEAVAQVERRGPGSGLPIVTLAGVEHPARGVDHDAGPMLVQPSIDNRLDVTLLRANARHQERQSWRKLAHSPK